MEFPNANIRMNSSIANLKDRSSDKFSTRCVCGQDFKGRNFVILGFNDSYIWKDRSLGTNLGYELAIRNWHMFLLWVLFKLV